MAAPADAGTLLLWGDADRLIPAAQAESWASFIPGAQIRKLPGSGRQRCALAAAAWGILPGMTASDHRAVPPVLAGAPLPAARAAAIVVHGRGQDPGYMLDQLVGRLGIEGVAYVLPRAAGGTWYPQRFLVPAADNEPALTAALAACEAAYTRLADAGLGPERIVVVGFSQGGCLVADFVARTPRPYAGVALLTGALIGAEGEVTVPGRLDGVPVYLGTSELDEWVPVERVRATARAFASAGADVTLDVVADPEHRIREQDVAAVAGALAAAAGVAPPARPPA